MTKSEVPYNMPDWISGELLDALQHYMIMRKRKGMNVSDRVLKSRVKQLETFKRYPNIDTTKLIEIVDNASDGNGLIPWLRFYLPKGYVAVEEKPVQSRQDNNGKTYSFKDVATKLHKKYGKK